ncbi:hypothetical protein SS50377_27473 [Spironucleus salmonicida]|uniref:Uncharacterized protein n=1 Tax=Spironucleus salmonicida TaxID=348837 RepID=V6LRP3_9EUKA|nr:hypothetical protein SS50377_27473 [Spironucleus salmonicida]|eukprot:EST46933.1 Hypothetical protein SS50377_13090 [Spironucleus salmonicida]
MKSLEFLSNYPDYKQHTFLTGSMTPLRSRPTTGQRPLSRPKSVKRLVSAFDNPHKDVQKNHCLRLATRTTLQDFDQGKLEQFMAQRECLREERPRPQPQKVLDTLQFQKPSIPDSRFQVGQQIVKTQKQNTVQNITDPVTRNGQQNSDFPNALSFKMNEYEADIAVKMRDMYMLCQGHSFDYIKQTQKQGLHLNDMYKKPEYQVFPGSKSPVQIKSNLYEMQRKKPYQRKHGPYKLIE